MAELKPVDIDSPLKHFLWKSEHGEASTIIKKAMARSISEMLEDCREQGKPVLVDTETTGLHRNSRLRLVQVGSGIKKDNRAFLLQPQFSSMRIEALMDVQKGYILCFHNAAFDLLQLAKWYFQDDIEKGYEWMIDKAVRGQVICTMTTAQIVESSPRSSSLADLAKQEGITNKYADRFNDRAEKLGLSEDEKYEKIPINDKAYIQYSAHDIFQLKAVYRKYKGHYNNPLVYNETVCSVLYGILRHRGMSVDIAKALLLHEDLENDLVKVQERLLKDSKIENHNSTAQVAKALKKAGVKLKDKTPTGRPKVAKKTLEAIRDKGKPKEGAEIAERVLVARSLSKDMASAANLAMNSDGDRVYPNLWMIGTVTGRSSCSAPNLQQLNKHSGDQRVRGLLRADKGERIGAVDFDGIELRTIADLAKDKRLCEKLMAGADIHGELAAEIYGKKFTPKERNSAKTGIFAMLYGASTASIAIEAGCTIEEAQGLELAWRELYPKVAKASDKWEAEANETGYTVLPNGWTPSVGLDARGRIAGYRAVNYQIQGMAAFLFRQAAIQLAEAGLWRYVRMVVHDEFVLSLPKGSRDIIEEIKAAATVKRQRMTYTTSGEIYGRHWQPKSA